MPINLWKMKDSKIPEDLGIIGFDNINATDFTNQAITSID